MILVVLILLAALFLLGANHLGGNTPACPQPPAPSPQIGAMAAAIARAEGSPTEWNNPGDLTAAFGYPTEGTANSAGVLKFRNCVDGWNALYKQLSLIVNGESRYTLDTTLADFGMAYSGNDPNWARNVASILGVNQSATLGEILT